MKTKFEFRVTSKNLWLQGPQSIKLAPIEDVVDNSTETPVLTRGMIINLELQSREDKDHQNDSAVFVTIPGNPEQTKEVALTIMRDLIEHLYLFYGQITLSPLICGERIPETDEEREEIGENPYYMQFSFQEVEQTKEFDPLVLRLFPGFRSARRIVHLFNNSDRASNPIDKYLSLYKVIESEFHTVDGKRQVLIKNSDLRNLVREFMPSVQKSEEEITNYIGELIDTRHKCAHLKTHLNFGYTPYDPAIVSEVIPKLNVLQKCVLEIIRTKYSGACPDAAKAYWPNQAL